MILIIATRNLHKLAEVRTILGPSCRCRSLADFPGAPPVVEDQPSFAGNATKKAVVLADWLAAGPGQKLFATPDSFVLADDSGLEVDVLAGAPSVHSARFAALDSGVSGNSSDAENNAKLLRLLQHVPPEKRTARFRCALALVALQRDPIKSGDRRADVFEGTCEGRIDLAPRGASGFGYDPLFVPNGYQKSFAELGEVEKNRLSHRARALALLRTHLDED